MSGNGGFPTKLVVALLGPLHSKSQSRPQPGGVQSSKGGRSMKRIALAALAGAAVIMAGFASAQQAKGPDWDSIQIKTTDLGNKTYRLEGQGGNITLAVGSDGIIMVDTQFAPLSDKIKAAIKAISPLPVKYAIITHYHGDHTGGIANFQKDGVIALSQDNIRIRLVAGTTNATTGNKMEARSCSAIPKETYVRGQKTIEVGGRNAILTHYYNAHRW